MKELKESVKRIENAVANIDKNVAINTQSLVTHMKRTDANEQRILYLERIFMGLTATSLLAGIMAVALKFL